MVELVEQRGVEDDVAGHSVGRFPCWDRRANYEERPPAWRKRMMRAQRATGRVEAMLHRCGGRERHGCSKEVK